MQNRREMFIYDQQGAIFMGIEQGKRDVSRNLLSQLNDDAIAVATGLSLEVIEALRREMEND